MSSGRRVAVTTAGDPAARAAADLRHRDLEPVMLPCIRIVPSPPHLLERARTAAREADWILLTSARAVSATWPDGGMPPVPIAAVGRSTASAASRAGGTVEITGRRGAASLIHDLEPLVSAKRVAFPHASGTGAAAADRLRRAGATVVTEVAYETKPVAPPSEPVDAATFASPSAITGWCLSRSLEGIVVAVIGPTTADAVRQVGREPEVVASIPGMSNLVEALAGHLTERSST